MKMHMLFLRRRARPALDLSFLGGLPSGVTFTRASAGWHFNSAGTLTQASSDVPRCDHDPNTLAPNGLWLEEQRTNSVRNAAAAGATVGTLGSGGALPTNWIATGGSGVTISVAAVGTEKGMAYVDVRFQASSAAVTSASLRFESNTGIAAANGQSWTTGFYSRQSAGSLSGITAFQAATAGMNGGGTDMESSASAFTPSSAWQRPYCVRALNNATTAYLSPRFNMTFNSGAAFDVTLRFAAPQAEQGEFPTSPIVTAGATATRAADIATVSPLGAWFNAAEGAFACEYRNDGAVPSSYFSRVASFNDNTINNEISLFVNGGLQRLCGVVKVAGATLADTSNTAPYEAPVEGAVLRQAMRYRLNDIAVSNNGGAIQTDNSCAIPSVTQLRFFRRETTGVAINSGWLRRFRYWNYGLDDVTLQRV